MGGAAPARAGDTPRFPRTGDAPCLPRNGDTPTPPAR